MAEPKIVLNAVDQTKAAFDSAQRNMASLGSQASSISAKFGTLGLAIGAALSAGSLMGMVDVLDQLDAMSERTGISTERLSELRAAASLSDTSLEALGVGLKKLSTNMADALGGGKEAQAKFGAMGITPDQLATFKTADQLFEALADKFSSYQDGARKNALATDIFGKRGEELIGTLNKGSAGLRELSDEAQKLGAVFGGDLGRLASDFNDNLARMKLVAEGAKVSLLRDLLPSLVNITFELIEGKKAFGGWLSFAYEMGFKTSPFDSWSDSAKKASANVENLKAEIAKLESSARPIISNGGGAAFIGPSGSGRSASRLKAAKEELDAETKRKTYFDSLIFKRFKGESDRLENLYWGPKSDAPTGKTVQPNDPNSGENFVQRLQRMVAAKEQDAFASLRLEAAQKGVSMGAEIYIAILEREEKQKKRTQQLTEQITRDLAYEAEQRSKASNFVESANDTAGAILRETQLLGLNANEQRRLTEMRKIDQAMQQAGAGASSETRQELERVAAVMKGNLGLALDQQIAKQNELNASWEYGANTALSDYLKQVGDVASETKNLMTNAFKGMEDALVDFVKNGKLDFSSLADSFISDMIRIEVRKNITKPLATMMQDSGGISGMLSSFIGALGFRANGGSVDQKSPYIVGERGPELFIPDAGGTIIPNHQLGGGGNSLVVNVIESPGNGGQQNRRTENGVDVLDIMVEKIKSSIAGDISRGSGSVPAAMSRTYGLNRTVGGY